MKKSVFCIIMSAFIILGSLCNVFAGETSPYIRITKMEKDGAEAVLSAYAPEKVDYVTVMICKTDDEGQIYEYYTGEDGSLYSRLYELVYIDQIDMPETDSKGRFTTTLKMKEALSNEENYVVRIGGSRIDKPEELVFSEQAVFYGDIDRDGAVTTEDAYKVLNYVLDKEENPIDKIEGKEYSLEEQLLIANVSGGKEISAADAAYIAKKALDGGFDFPDKIYYDGNEN